ncbi:hypothetical protein NQ314_012806 [Rhamnusium bicolor]|uniref:ABC transporter domain-containing protein n=1 Tax=Rhamnusium bicolor TaxID=1586634 RepID=A0AAV8XA05_9CUCU|nr:hypothetical protein NQ314_012806 [Rhamnusium bicolor]
MLLFLLIAYGRSKISGLNKVEVTESTYNELQPISYDFLGVDETHFYYSPNNEFYQDIIKRAQVKLQMYNNNIKGFDSSHALLQYYTTHHNNTVIAIIFNGNDQKKMDYIIRYHDGYYTRDLNTAEMYKNKYLFAPGGGSDYYYKGLLSIQKALDISYIEKLSGRNLDANITIGMLEFPYPPHIVDSAITTVFDTYIPLITLFSFIFLCPAVLKRVVEEKESGNRFAKRLFTKWESQVESESVHLDNVEEGHGMKKGIEIQNLTKKFGHKFAVNNLSLDIYQNQITVLIGPNGAGKSTTMSMITGMIDITSGNIKMNGKNIKGNMDEIRKHLGLCPQHNLLFTDLTVGEHLEFFARLKGKSSEEAKQEMLILLQKLNLTEKKDAMANTLSGELWDLLQAWRGEKTILITTHFMEEADALGDWIAIMGDGTLRCYGTPMYLKKTYEVDEIKRIILYKVPDAKFKGSYGNNMVFVLPFEKNMTIADLFSFLEERKDNLKIENISITVTTLEDVFLKVKIEHETENDNITTLDPEGM